jgi:SprT protein
MTKPDNDNKLIGHRYLLTSDGGKKDWNMFHELEGYMREAYLLAMNDYPNMKDCFNAIDLKLNNRMRSVAGRARYNKRYNRWEIHINYRLHRENREELKSTYLHELAHVLANRYYNTRCNHDSRWRRINKTIGGTDENCHNMEVEHLKAKQRRYDYACKCTTHKISAVRHNRMQKGTKRYICMRCKTRIEQV